MDTQETVQDIIEEMKRNGIPVIDHYAKRIEAALAEKHECRMPELPKERHVFADLYSDVTFWSCNSTRGIDTQQFSFWLSGGESGGFGRNSCMQKMKFGSFNRIRTVVYKGA